MPDFDKATIEYSKIKIHVGDSAGFIGTLLSRRPDKDLAALRETRRVLHVEDNRDQGWIAVHLL